MDYNNVIPGWYWARHKPYEDGTNWGGLEDSLEIIYICSSKKWRSADHSIIECLEVERNGSDEGGGYPDEWEIIERIEPPK